MRMPRRATWIHLKYRLGIFRTIRNHVNAIRSHVKACEIPLRNLHRATWKHMKYKSAIFRSIESHPNTTQSLLKTLENGAGIFKSFESHTNTMQSRLKTIEILLRNLQTSWKPGKYHVEPYEHTWKSSDLLKAMQIPCSATWKHVKYHSDIFTPVESYEKNTQSHVKTPEILFRNR